jgi:hypothetical protein
MRTDRQTDMTKLTIVFRNFANAPKKSLYLWYRIISVKYLFSVEALIAYLV